MKNFKINFSLIWENGKEAPHEAIFEATSRAHAKKILKGLVNTANVSGEIPKLMIHETKNLGNQASSFLKTNSGIARRAGRPLGVQVPTKAGD